MEHEIDHYVASDGTFTESFISGLPDLLGDDFKEVNLKEMFERTPNFETLLKNYAHTKRAYSTKMDNVIQKPDANATDEQKAAFRQTLLEALGRPQSAADYHFQPPSLPEGMKYNEALDKAYAELFAQVGLPIDMATAIRNHFIDENIKSFNASIEAENKAFDTAVERWNAKYPGDQAIAKARAAHELLMDIASDDIKGPDGEVIKGLKSIIKEAGLYDAPTDYKKWRSVGIELPQLELLSNLAEKTKGGRMLGNDQAPGPQKSPEDAFVAAVNAGSPGFSVEGGAPAGM